LNTLASAFITFEGIDGSGKSTQMRLLASELRLRGHEVVSTREPGGTPLGTRIRELVLDAEEQVDPLAELLLYAADRAQHVRALVRPALDSGRVVLSDRYADATAAYQGAGRGFPEALVSELIVLATGGLMPDLTLVFDLTVEESRRRARKRTDAVADQQKHDRLDAEDAAFHTRVRDAYLKLAAAEPDRVRIIEAGGSIQETQAQVMKLVLPYIESRV
jgi:dTMP kinase